MSKVRFGDVVTDVKSKVDRNNNPYDFYVAGDHMDTEDLKIHRRGRFDTDDVGPAFIREFKAGQILYGSRRTYLKKVAVADFDGVTANTTFVFETSDENKFLQGLLPFVMLSEGFTQWSIMKSKGSTNPYILFSDLADYEFELPGIDKQRELAKVLWAMDTTKKAYHKLLLKTDELVKSQFIEMFGDPQINSKSLTVISGKDAFVFSSGKANTIENLNDMYEYPCYGGNGITGHSKEYLCQNSTLVIGRVGEYCGSVHLTQPKSWITDNAIYIKDFRTDFFELEFLYYEFLLLDFHRFANTVGQPKITQAPLASLLYIVPSKDEQKQFIKFARQCVKSKFELEQALVELTATYKKIISENLG